jgi:hypothetical protein
MPLVSAFTNCPLLSRLVLIRRSFDCRRRFAQNLQHPHALVDNICARARHAPLQEWVGLDACIAAVVSIYVSLKTVTQNAAAAHRLLRVRRAHAPRHRSRPHHKRRGGQRRMGTPILQSRCSCSVQVARLPPHLLIQAHCAGFFRPIAQIW